MIWIRSQNRDMLVKLVCDDGRYLYIEDGDIYYGCTILGSYKDDKEAIFVMNAIECAIANDKKIYRMPKEEWNNG